MAWVQFILALPEMFRALKGAFELYKEMQRENFFKDNTKAFAKLEEAQTDDEIKEAVLALRSIYKRV